jgi:phosphoglycerate dehydrogenase-like enzyme
LGFGHIGKTTAVLAKSFKMRVVALRLSSITEDPSVDKFYKPEEKLALFKDADYVVNVLPGETVLFCFNFCRK